MLSGGAGEQAQGFYVQYNLQATMECHRGHSSAQPLLKPRAQGGPEQSKGHPPALLQCMVMLNSAFVFLWYLNIGFVVYESLHYHPVSVLVR